jgi:hypothetical protein
VSALLSESYRRAITATDQPKSFYHYGRIYLKGFCTDGVSCFAWSPRENTKKSIMGCTFFDGCMMDG